MDPFSWLPAELILDIISHIDDVASVDSLTIASSHVSAVIEARSSVAHDLLRTVPSMGLAEIKQLCYSIVIIGTSHYSGNASYWQACQIPTELDGSTSLTMIHPITKIQRLASLCLSRMHGNLLHVLKKILVDRGQTTSLPPKTRSPGSRSTELSFPCFTSNVFRLFEPPQPTHGIGLHCHCKN